MTELLFPGQGWIGPRPPTVPFELNRDSLQAKGLQNMWSAIHIATLRGRGPFPDSTFTPDFVGSLDVEIRTAISLSPAKSVGWALNLDGDTDRMVVSSDIENNLTGEATLSMWLRINVDPPAAPEQTGFVRYSTSESAASHYPWTDGDIYIATLRSTRVDSISDSGFDKTNWHMVTVVSRGTSGDWEFWQNDNQIATASGEAIPTAATVWFGQNSAGHNLDGDIADIKFYSRALSAAEIRHLYNPFTRWDLYRPNPRMFVVSEVAAPAGNPLLLELQHHH